jgi:hypothetical protein
MVHFDYLTLDGALALPNPVLGAEANNVADPFHKAWQWADIILTASRFIGQPSHALAVIVWDHNEQQYADIRRWLMSGEKILNGVDVKAVTSLIDAVKDKPDLAESRFQIDNEWIDGGHNRTTVTGFYSACQEISHTQPFVVDADEPPILAGKDQGLNPVEHLLNALAS